MKTDLSPDGERLLTAFELLHSHIESHHCAECWEASNSLVRALTKLMVKPDSKEENNDWD